MLYINDLPMTISGCGIDVYADDSTLYKAHKDHTVVQQTLQTNLDVVNNWCAINNMPLNSAKTKYMILATPYKHRVLENKNDSLVLSINGYPIEIVTHQKCLGVYIDNTLSWNIHCNKTCSKINSKIALFKRI